MFHRPLRSQCRPHWVGVFSAPELETEPSHGRVSEPGTLAAHTAAGELVVRSRDGTRALSIARPRGGCLVNKRREGLPFGNLHYRK